MSGSFKSAGRRVGWYLRSGWMQWHIAHDPFFNFTENVTPEVVSRQEKFLNTAQHRLPPVAWHGDKMLVEAYWAHDALRHENQALFHKHFEAFKRQANEVLNVDVSKATSPATRPTEKAVFENFKLLADETLGDFAELMSGTKWDWFVTGGTLLGAVRERDFLAHDNDLDVGSFVDPSEAEELELLFANDPTFTTAKMDIKTEIVSQDDGQLTLHREPALLKLVHQNGVNLDIFFHYVVGEHYVHGSGTMRWENARFGLSEYTLGDRTVLGPDNADLYLTEHYGNWREERKDFSCVTDTTNISYVQNLFTMAFHIRRLNFLSLTEPMRAIEIEHSLINQGLIQKSPDGLALSRDLFPMQPTVKSREFEVRGQNDNTDALERRSGQTYRGKSPQTVH